MLLCTEISITRIYHMDFISEDISGYCERHTDAESELLAELSRYTQARVLQPRMLAGHLQGRMIAMFSHLIKPKTVVEIGTYTGYSALCWAEGLTEGGTVHTIEINDELESVIRSFFDRSPYRHALKLHIGPALDVIDTLMNPIDIVYIDADKENYVRYYEAVINKVRPGGLIIADNVLWSGKVLGEPEPTDIETQTLQNYAARLRSDARVSVLMLPVRDGWMIARKL